MREDQCISTNSTLEGAECHVMVDVGRSSLLSQKMTSEVVEKAREPELEDEAKLYNMMIRLQ